MADKEALTSANGAVTWSKEELIKIKSRCPKSWATQISVELGIGEGTIRNVMNGFKQNDEVILLAIKIGDSHQERLTLAKQKVADL